MLNLEDLTTELADAKAELESNSLQIEQLSSDVRELTAAVRDMVAVTEESLGYAEEYLLDGAKHLGWSARWEVLYIMSAGIQVASILSFIWREGAFILSMLT